MTTYPFADSANFQLHCAGGAGGETRYLNGLYFKGSNGASNGQNSLPGANTGVSSSTSANQALGGTQGGGVGGWSGSPNGGHATFYGSGGGAPFFNDINQQEGAPGNGYGGVLYIRYRLDIRSTC